VFWFSLQLLSETFLILRRNERDIKYIYIHIKYPLFLSDFNETWILLTNFRKIHKYRISWISVKWEPSCSIRTDGRTDRQKEWQADMTKLIVAVRNFANVPKNTPLTVLQLSKSPSKKDSLKCWLSNMPVLHEWGEMFISEVLQYYYTIQNQLVNQPRFVITCVKDILAAHHFFCKITQVWTLSINLHSFKIKIFITSMRKCSTLLVQSVQ